MSPTTAPRPSTIAFVTIVVPCATDASGSPPASVESPFITPSAGLAGVVGTLPLVSRPDGARTTTSVKVPPTSMPTLVPAMRERLARCTTEASSGLEVQDGDSARSRNRPVPRQARWRQEPRRAARRALGGVARGVRRGVRQRRPDARLRPARGLRAPPHLFPGIGPRVRRDLRPDQGRRHRLPEPPTRGERFPDQHPAGWQERLLGG